MKQTHNQMTGDDPWPRWIAVIGILISLATLDLAYTATNSADQKAKAAEANKLTARIAEISFDDGGRLLQVHASETPTEIESQDHTIRIDTTNRARSDASLWLVIKTINQDRFYPFLIPSGSKPFFPHVNIGSETDHGSYQLIVYAVPPPSEGIMGAAPAGMPLDSLPAGLTTLSAITVHRDY
jgi:hypothetical protein